MRFADVNHRLFVVVTELLLQLVQLLYIERFDVLGQLAGLDRVEQVLHDFASEFGFGAGNGCEVISVVHVGVHHNLAEHLSVFFVVVYKDRSHVLQNEAELARGQLTSLDSLPELEEQVGHHLVVAMFCLEESEEDNVRFDIASECLYYLATGFLYELYLHSPFNFDFVKRDLDTQRVAQHFAGVRFLLEEHVLIVLLERHADVHGCLGRKGFGFVKLLKNPGMGIY